MAKLNGKVGIVTGGGTGIGRATALAMANAGATVVIGNRDAARGEEVVQLILQATHGVVSGEPEFYKAAFGATAAEFEKRVFDSVPVAGPPGVNEYFLWVVDFHPRKDSPD